MTGMSERKYRINLEVPVIYIIVSNLVFTMGKQKLLTCDKTIFSISVSEDANKHKIS